MESKGKRSGGCLLALAIALWAFALQLAPATAQSAPFQALLNPDGSGRLFVNNGSEPSWAVCEPSLSNCRPFASGGDVTTAGAPPNVVFRAETGSLTEPQWVTPTWHGNVTPLAPPFVTGTIRANELVTPVPGRWQGGWSTDHDTTQLSACKSPAGGDCITLTDSRYPASCSGGAAVLDPVFVGRYLRVADRRLAADTTTTLEGVNSPYGHEVWPPTAITSVAMAGRIGPPTHARASQCGPPPLVRASISAGASARVRCGLGCHASLLAKRNGRTVQLARTLRPFPLAAPTNYPIPKLSLSSRALSRLGHGRARVVVLVDGKRAADRTVVLP